MIGSIANAIARFYTLSEVDPGALSKKPFALQWKTHRFVSHLPVFRRISASVFLYPNRSPSESICGPRSRRGVAWRPSDLQSSGRDLRPTATPSGRAIKGMRGIHVSRLTASRLRGTFGSFDNQQQRADPEDDSRRQMRVKANGQRK
jgi:hypothetical protein